MDLIKNKNGIIFGVANEHSIATGIAKVLSIEGANIGFTHFPGEKMLRRVERSLEDLKKSFLTPCDVSKDEDIKSVFEVSKSKFKKLDFIVHSVAFANPEDLSRPYFETTRDGFKLALDVSAYSLVAIAREYIKAYGNEPCSIIALTYLGSERAIRNYNVMGVAKAALEASVRYLALELGPHNIRVNAISPGPIKTLSALGVGGFKDLLNEVPKWTCLKRNVTQEEVGKTALYLLSELSSGVTGEIIYVDAGFNIIGA